jgi:hypothetical protein
MLGMTMRQARIGALAMKRNRTPYAILLVAFLILILVVVGIATCGHKEKAGPEDSSPTPTLSTSASPPPSLPPSTPSPTVSPTVSPMGTLTPLPSIFQGSIDGIWSGTIEDTTPTDIHGTFSVVIDAKGDIQGTFDGAFKGTISGHVDLDGDLTAIGTASRGTSTDTTSWQGKLSVSGSVLTTEGVLSGDGFRGEFSGTGVASH